MTRSSANLPGAGAPSPGCSTDRSEILGSTPQELDRRTPAWATQPTPAGATRGAADPVLSVWALDVVSHPVTALLEAFLAERVADLTALDPSLSGIGREVANLVAAGGKRLRPAFVYWGACATGAEPAPGVVTAAAAVELLHTFALIHDDVMDRSPDRRGRPAVHEALAAAHRRDRLTGDAGWFGVGGAILAGDLAFVWADSLLDAAELDPRAHDRARRVFTQLRVEVMAGQYLDLRLAGAPDATEAEALQVALLKAGRYTVTRPLQMGAALGDGGPALDAALRGYGDAVGIGFQLRDDVLGLFGDPRKTGKGALDDLREGKRTLLVLRALQLAPPAQGLALRALLGSPDLDSAGVDRAREIVAGCGALAAVEELLAGCAERACRALRPVPQPARDALVELAELALYRAA